MYKVLSVFADLQDFNHTYNVGDVYPRAGYTPSDARVDELSTNKNIQGKPLIQLVEETKVVKEPEPVVEEVVEKTTRGRKKKDVGNTD